MAERDKRLSIPNPHSLDRQKIEQASLHYPAFAGKPEVRMLIQAPPLAGQVRDRKY